ncbi:MAG: polysaccharide pyruvyl transferase family protein [Lachnospiraceae bacterium]
MKIGIITFHFPYNCGAALQCYALQTAIEKEGHEVVIINYRPWYHQNRYTRHKNPMTVAKQNYLRDKDSRSFRRRLISGIYWYFHAAFDIGLWRKNKESEAVFGIFVKKYLHETRIYRTLDDLKKSPPEADLYICGSDQLWNTLLTGGEPDKAYFLDFGPENIRRRSYAVGVNIENPESLKEEIGPLLNRFEAISLRERACEQQVREMCDKDIPMQFDKDPTLLLDREEYEALIPDVIFEDRKYVMLYLMGDPSEEKAVELAKVYAKQNNLQLINVIAYPSRKRADVDKNIICGPEKFLWYIKNAKKVYTNSYHAVIFSMIFDRDFNVVPHETTGYRVRELLERYGRSDCCIEE